MKTFFIFLLITCFLSACVDPVTTSAVSSGAQAVYNRNSIQTSINDNLISMRANRAIYLDTDRYKDTNVSAATLNTIVLLTGQVSTQQQREEIANLVKKIPGVDKVYNFIEIAEPTSSLIQTSDAWITAKIKTRLLATDDVDPSQIKVVTENGTVYLMGILPPESAAAAVEIARTTAGVQNVVKIFLYLRISKT